VTNVEPTSAFVGALRTGVRPIGYPRRRASARSAHLIILADRLVFRPFGIVRGISGDVVLMKHDITSIHPSTPYLFLGAGYGQIVVFEKLVPNSSVPEGLYYFPRKSAAFDVLNALELSGYEVDRTPQKPRILG
jgi:hypothetical protein